MRAFRSAHGICPQEPSCGLFRIFPASLKTSVVSVPNYERDPLSLGCATPLQRVGGYNLERMLAGHT